MAKVMTSFEVEETTLDHYTALADRLGVSRSELMRTALQQVQDANPVDEDELVRARAKRTKSTKVSLGAGGKLIAMAEQPAIVAVREERPDIAATHELAQRTYGGGASLAAEGGEARYRRGEGRKRREGESDPRPHKVLSRLASPDHLSTVRPAMRPDHRGRTRHLRAV